MECRAEINRFAIFLFCLLVPLGSLAPTETSESKLTTAERENSFTTDIPRKSAAIKNEAQDLFEIYKNCVSATFHLEPEKNRSEARDMAEKIPACPPFHANCCVLQNIYNILEILESHIVTLCKKSSEAIKANLNQLNTTLSHGTAFYNTCKDQDLRSQVQTMSWADKKTYIWWFLKRYQDIMQTPVKPHYG